MQSDDAEEYHQVVIINGLNNKCKKNNKSQVASRANSHSPQGIQQQ